MKLTRLVIITAIAISTVNIAGSTVTLTDTTETEPVLIASITSAGGSLAVSL